MTNAVEKLGWLVLAVIGAVALGTVALNRGETVNAVWLGQVLPVKTEVLREVG